LRLADLGARFARLIGFVLCRPTASAAKFKQVAARRMEAQVEKFARRQTPRRSEKEGDKH